jgi:pyruvate kinase
MRHTKIVATVGPATNSDAAIRALIDAGVDIFRLNFSHGNHDGHAAVIKRIRAAADAARRCTAILQDLGGPKIRTGKLRGGLIELTAGEELAIAVGDFIGEPGRISTTYADLPRSVGPGDPLLLDDGRVQLRVLAKTATELRTLVVHGGQLGDHKGINAPGAPLPAVGLTPKDAEDLKFGVQMDVDFIALSFVQSADDLHQAREALGLAGAPHVPLIAKLERPEAIAHLPEILEASDGVMVARGDLGLELPLERVPRVQKEITRKARAAGLPVILATQVLESMRTEPRPTRAEVSDAANAVDDGVDAIMLAGETAVGKYPVESVKTLDAVIRDAETMSRPAVDLSAESHLLSGHGRALCEAAVTLANRAGAAAIVAITRGGKTARLLAALRPPAPIFAATEQQDISRRLALSWGVIPVVTDLSGDVETNAVRIGEHLVGRGSIPSPSVIVVVSINPDLSRGRANFLKLQRIG